MACNITHNNGRLIIIEAISRQLHASFSTTASFDQGSIGATKLRFALNENRSKTLHNAYLFACDLMRCIHERLICRETGNNTFLNRFNMGRYSKQLDTKDVGIYYIKTGHLNSNWRKC